MDPLPAFNFVVELIGDDGQSRAVAGFTECTGLDSTLEIAEYQAGGVNDRVYKFPSRFTFSNISLKQGVSLDLAMLREWHGHLLSGQTDRRDGLIKLRDEQGNEVLAWKFERGLPAKWEGPALNAKQSEVSIETLEIAHEHLEPFDLNSREG
jgi:phage tail-like protein